MEHTMFARLFTIGSLVAAAGATLASTTSRFPKELSSLLARFGAARMDTIDVEVGSPALDTKGMRAFTTHLQVRQVGGGKDVLQQEATNTITFGDSAGSAVTRVSSIGHVQTPNGMVSNSAYYTFDRNTLALRSMRNVLPRGELTVQVAGTKIDVSMPTPAGPQAISLQLTAPAFYAQWSDFVVEELPRREGAVYRVRLWRPAMAPGQPPRLAEETHLYTVTKREDIDVLGKPVRGAWVVEDRIVGQPNVVGRMWIIDGAPKLVRWTIYGNGSDTRIDQELAPE
jgi:hypothetical protein